MSAVLSFFGPSPPQVERLTGGQWRWLAVLVVAACAPHGARLPMPLTVAVVALPAWRWWNLRRGQGRTPRWQQVGVVFAGLATLFFGYPTAIGVEPAVGLLVLSALAKVLEARTRRDGLVLVFLAYFLTITPFLFTQSIAAAGYAAGLFLLATTTLNALNRFDAGWSLQPLRTAAGLAVQAAPLMLVLFLLFPRVGPLWSVPLASPVARTGPSSTLSPGDIAALSESSELAFRARFAGGDPPADALYWRGLVLSEFDGRTWRRGLGVAASMARRPEPPEDAIYRYQVTMEPSARPWVFTLDGSWTGDPRLKPSGSGTWAALEPVERRLQLDFEVGPAQSAASLGPVERQIALQLPAVGNPEARVLAAQWRNRFGADSGAVIDAALRYFRSAPFHYTLEPGKLGPDSMDEFLFDSRAGYCGHYASAFVFLMRSAGIPARVVTGYQGGEFNAVNGYFIVREYDAHAWAEVWSPAQGWVVVDPTQAVAPERIAADLRSRAFGVVDEAEGAAASLWTRWWQRTRLSWDAAQYHWVRWVLNYDLSRQQSLFGLDASLKSSLAQLGRWLLVAVLVVFGAIALWLVKRAPRSAGPVQRAYEQALAALARAGFQRGTGEGPQAFAERVGAARADLGADFAAVTAALVAQRYGGGTLSPPSQSALRAQVRALQRATLDRF